MDDVQVLILAFAEEAIRRKKAEITLSNALEENKRLAAQVAELTPKAETNG